MLSDVCLSVAYIGLKSRTERPRKTEIGTEVAHVTHDSDTTFKVKGQGHQAALVGCTVILDWQTNMDIHMVTYPYAYMYIVSPLAGLGIVAAAHLGTGCYYYYILHTGWETGSRDVRTVDSSDYGPRSTEYFGSAD